MSIVKNKHLGYLDKMVEPKICDVGGLYNSDSKSYYQLFKNIKRSNWIVADIVEHQSVDVVMPSPYSIPFPDETFDLVISGQMLEHSANPFKSVAEMKRILKTGCCLAIIAPSTGPRHDKQDGWRFLDDAFRFIVEDIGGIEIIEDWIDKRNDQNDRSAIWHDHIFVGRKTA